MGGGEGLWIMIPLFADGSLARWRIEEIKDNIPQDPVLQALNEDKDTDKVAQKKALPIMVHWSNILSMITLHDSLLAAVACTAK